MPSKSRNFSKWDPNDPAQVARNALRDAVRTRKMTKPRECQVCGKEARLVGHHWRGYDHPLDVWWVCDECNSSPALTHDGTQTFATAREAMRRSRTEVDPAMFVGSINSDTRAVLAEQAVHWRGLPVWVGCSGNFSVERLLVTRGIDQLHGNDVSLYSCCLGAHLTGQPFRLEIREEGYRWLEPFLAPGPGRIAALLLCSDMLPCDGKEGAYHERRLDAYRRHWPELHQKTTEKVSKAVGKLNLASFWPGDVLDFASLVPDDAVFVTFPPTYKQGYERLYKRMEEVFDWDRPAYELFDDVRFEQLAARMLQRKHWLAVRDRPCETLADHLQAVVQTSPLSRPVHIYSSTGRKRLTFPAARVEPVALEHVQVPLHGPLSLARLSRAQFDALRALCLPKAIQTGPGAGYGRCCLAILAGGRLAGVISFERPRGDWADIYLLSDFGVPSDVPRLSKLIAAVALTREVKAIIEQHFVQRIDTVGTTAFTNRPASMKYRGAFDLFDRQPGLLNYKGTAGRWSLEEVLSWWRKRLPRAES